MQDNRSNIKDTTEVGEGQVLSLEEMNNTLESKHKHYFSSNQDHDAFYKLTTFLRHLPY